MNPDRLRLDGNGSPFRIYLFSDTHLQALGRATCLKGIVSAHVHLPFACEVFPGVTQWIAEAGFRDGFRWVQCSP